MAKLSLSTKSFFAEQKDACNDGVQFASQFSSMHEAWEKCERGDWMMWAARRLNLLSKKQSVKLAIAFAEHALPRFEAKYPDDKRPRKAIAATKKWLKSPTEKNADAAANAADAADAAADAAA